MHYFSPGKGLKQSALPKEWEDHVEAGDDLAHPEQATSDVDNDNSDDEDAEGRFLVGQALTVANDN